MVVFVSENNCKSCNGQIIYALAKFEYGPKCVDVLLPYFPVIFVDLGHLIIDIADLSSLLRVIGSG